jgi:hypothetical protein
MNVVIAYLYGDLNMEIYRFTQVKWLPTTERVRYKVVTLTLWIETIRMDVVYPSKWLIDWKRVCEQ